MAMKIRDSSDEAINGSKRNESRSKKLSSSSGEEFVIKRNKGDLLGKEVNECTPEEEYSESDSKEVDLDKERQQIKKEVQ
ncbi:hypothetical protein NPIL_43831 [Nephila pilipes]|uniref:Uncharacterized protein n=1 Tax=Nephila pilipes TaxID=299642 RepID=A0A8X6NWU9_NEPPI|nr:hypothetical protein NPIL_43831 [Nephila pilipes]